MPSILYTRDVPLIYSVELEIGPISRDLVLSGPGCSGWIPPLFHICMADFPLQGPS